MRRTFPYQETPNTVILKHVVVLAVLAFFALAFVVLAAVSGGFSGAFFAVALSGLGFALVALVMWIGILPFLWAKEIGEIVIEGPIVADPKTGRAIDLRMPHELTPLVSRGVVRTTVESRHNGTYEQSLNYEWAAFLLRQGTVELAILQKQVSASTADIMTRAGRRADRWFLGREGVVTIAVPTSAVYLSRGNYGDVERALAEARAEGARQAMVAQRRAAG